MRGTKMTEPMANIKFMFDTLQPGSDPGETVPVPAPGLDLPGQVPLERLEAQICELAGHLAAATGRFLVLLGDFDARRGWASWDMTSCAAWLSWKCQMSSGAAREHVRVARALRDLPVIRGEFAAGRLSYAKVRALTRIATPENEQGLAELAGPMTGSQLERFARAHRKVGHADDAAARIQRRLTWRFDDDGSLAGTFRLPPLAGAALLQALRAAAADLEHPHDDDAGVSAETSRAAEAVPGHPADPARCHVEDGSAISVTTAQMLACTAALSWMLHDHDGTLLDVGRRRRRPTAALRRAARERDKCRCRYPGCESRRVDLHHVQYWSNGGRTKLTNLISLCRYHHMLVHERGYLIASAPGGAFTFYRPGGAVIPSSPALPDADGPIDGCHDADITPGTIVPAWYGERLDLDYAIYTCFANAEYQARHRDDRDGEELRAARSPAVATAPEAEPSRPTVTEVDVIAGVRTLYQEHALN
jgi:hypothetical protein